MGSTFFEPDRTELIVKTTETIDDAEERLQDGLESSDRLQRRDYIVLPLLSLLTLVVMFAGAEVVTRIFWPEGGTDVCAVYDPMTGFREKPNCTALLKSPETPWVAHTFNNCGYRTVEPCGLKPPGTIRIAPLGSSIAEGYLVPYPDTFAVQAASLLTRLCHRPVEVQNLAAAGSEPIYVYHRMDEALALQPDAIIFAINPL